MLVGLLPNLPPREKSLGGMTFWQRLKPAPTPKKSFSIPKMKAVAKLLEGMGKQVTAVNVQSDGFTVTATTLGVDPATEPNEWDEVMPDGKA